MKEIDKLKLRIAALDIAVELCDFFRQNLNIVFIDDLRTNFVEEVVSVVESNIRSSRLIQEDENV